MRLLFVDFFYLFGEVVHRAFLELREANPGVTRLDNSPTHRLRTDFFTRDDDVKRAVFFLAEDRQVDFGVGLATHALDGFVQRQALDHGVVDFGDQVIGFETGLERG